MEDIRINKINIPNGTIEINLADFISKLECKELCVYDIDCGLYNECKSVIFYCVDTKHSQCILYIIKNVDNIYDTFGKVYNTIKYSVWDKYICHNFIDYKTLTLFKNLLEDEFEISNDLPLRDNELYHFSFLVDKNTDILQTDDDGKGFCSVSYYNNVDDMKTILKKYINKTNIINGHCLLEVAETVPCKERPYKIYLYGVDDSSYTKTYATLDEVKQVILNLKTFDKIYTEKFIEDYGFVFTN